MVDLKLKLGKKGYLIIPKLLRDRYGLKEGSWVLVELKDEGILIKPGKSIEELKSFFKSHAKKLQLLNIKSPKPGDLRGVSLEEEFE